MENQSWKVTGKLVGSDKVTEAPYRFATEDEAKDYASLATLLGIEGVTVKCELCDQPVNAEFTRKGTRTA